MKLTDGGGSENVAEDDRWVEKLSGDEPPKAILEQLASAGAGELQGFAKSFTSYLLGSKTERKRVVALTKAILKYSDVLHETLAAITPRIMKAGSDEAKWALIHFLRNIPSPVKTPLDSLFEQPDVDDQPSLEEVRRVRAEATESAWLQLTGLKLIPAQLRLAIPHFVEKVIDHLPGAALFADFLYDAFNRGGYLAVLSLAGIFKLVTRHDFEHPSFYPDVYFMIEPSVCYTGYARRFFDIVDVILSSSHVPIYVITAFVKRLSRVLLCAPLHCQLPLLTMLKNLLKRHGQVHAILVNREHPATLDADPYDEHERDLRKCRADQSSLWELKVIQHHWHVKVADKAASLTSHNVQDHEVAIDWLSPDEHFQKLVERSLAKLDKSSEHSTTDGTAPSQAKRPRTTAGDCVGEDGVEDVDGSDEGRRGRRGKIAFRAELLTDHKLFSFGF